MKILGARAVVIGAARGIGHAYCEALLQKGAKVYIGDVLSDVGEEATKRFQEQYGAEAVKFCKVDVTVLADVQEIFRRAQEAFGGIDIAVGNAGIIDEIDYEKCIDVNLVRENFLLEGDALLPEEATVIFLQTGTIRITNEALKYMGKDQGGHGGVIVHTASIGGLRPVDWQPAYCATKYGVVAFCRSKAMERNYSLHGVRICCVCPTNVRTDLLPQAARAFFPEHTLESFKHIHDSLKPSEVAEGLVQLVEDDTCNGTALRVTKHFRDAAEFLDSPQDLQ